jgi:hypothetical protein
MTTKEYSMHIKDLNAEMKRCGRSIVLLCDNVPTHTVQDAEVDEELGLKVINLSNVKLIFLPANTTSVIQPLDQGIIAAVKTHYWRLLVRWLLTEAGAAENKDKSLRELKPTSYQMMQWLQQAWTQCIAHSVIRNCWYKAGILPDGWVAASAGTGAQRTAIAQLQLAGIATAPTPAAAPALDADTTSEDSCTGSVAAAVQGSGAASNRSHQRTDTADDAVAQLDAALAELSKANWHSAASAWR